jgi:hypothetical protein
LPLRNAVFTSSWDNSRSLEAAIAISTRKEWYRTTGAKVS